MPHRPDYLAYTVPCPLNAGKLQEVVAWVAHWRCLAAREASWQWRHFFETCGSDGFQASARAGWTRPWVTSGESTVTLAQQVMAQVAGQLTGHLGNVQNTFACLVAGSSLSPDDKHRLFYLNRCRLWLFKGAVKSPITGRSGAIKRHPSVGAQALPSSAFPTPPSTLSGLPSSTRPTVS